MADTLGLVSEPSLNDVAVCDFITGATLTSVTGMTNAGAIAVLPNVTQAYVVSGASVPGQVFPINLPAYAAGPTITVGDQPFDIDASLDGTHVYTVNNISPTGSVTPIATPSNVPGADIVLTGTTSPKGIAVNPASSMVYVTAASGVNRGIIPIAIPSNVVGAAFGAAVLTGNNPLGIKVTPDGLHAYVASFTAGGIYPVDLIAQTVGPLITLTGSSFISDLNITPDGTQVFIPDGGTNTVYVVSTATNLQTHAISLAPHTHVPNSGGFDAAGENFFTTISSDNVVVGINTSTYAVTTAVSSVIVGPAFLNTIVSQAPPTPTYPGGTFIPTLFIPQKGKVTEDYTSAELMADWLAIEVWSQRWLPTPPVLFFSRKGSDNPKDLNANWLIMEEWVNQIIGLKAPYVPLLVPRKNSNAPFDLDIDFLAIQNWGNRIAHGVQ